MTYKQCVVCKLMFPISYIIPIIVNYQGKRAKVFICENCKTIKEAEAKK